MIISDVIVKPLKKIPDERGAVYHFLRRDDPLFKGFGEVYFSIVYRGVFKGWHRHKKMTLNYVVPYGMIDLWLKKDGKEEHIFIGSDNYCLVQVPPMIWNGFTGLGTTLSIVANCATEPYSEGEIERKDTICSVW